MSPRYTSPSSTPYGYQPLSPPWSRAGSPPAAHYDDPTRAPVMPYATLPPVDGYPPLPYMSPHHGLATPPPTPSELHPVLSTRSTVVRYDFAADPRTARLSSSAPIPIFPSDESASRPAMSFVYIECEASGHVFTVRGVRNGITCADVMGQIHGHLARSIGEEEWRCVQDPQRRAMKAAYTRRTGRPYHGHAGMKVIDYLMGQTVFKRLIPKRGDAAGSTWLLQTTAAH